jgi:hypothetical protein
MVQQTPSHATVIVQKEASTLYNERRESAIVHHSSELSERDLTPAQVELGVHVPHEHVPDDPEVRADVLAHDPADALRRAGRDPAEAERRRRDREHLAAKGEADAGTITAFCI